LPAPSWRPTLVAALVAAFALAPEAQAGAACGEPGYSYAGLRTAVGVRGVRARVTALDPALIADGQVVAWVGVGRATVPGKRGAIRVGLLATNGEANRLYYEILRPEGWRTFVGAYVAPGERHQIAVLELARRPGWWRVWIDGSPVSAALNLRGRGGRTAMATAETWRGNTGTCTPFQYRFAHISVLTPDRSWRGLKRSRRVVDSGFELVRPAPHTFLSSAKKKKPEPLPSPPPTPPAAPDDPSPPVGTTFLGDWETGDHSQWTGLQYRTGGSPADQFAVVDSPLRQGQYAARFTVRPGDKFGTSSGERTEVYWVDSDEGEGEEYWYAWSTLFPSDWSEPFGWGVFVQWHSQFPIPPPVSFNARADTAEISVNAGPLEPSGTNGSFRRKYPLLATLNKGSWNDFIARIRWSGTNGAIAVWHRLEGDSGFVKVVDVTGIPTLQSSGATISDNYLKLGLYRNADTKTNIIYHDDFRRWQSESPPPEIATLP
jgi:hypothetical protein